MATRKRKAENAEDDDYEANEEAKNDKRIRNRLAASNYRKRRKLQHEFAQTENRKLKRQLATEKRYTATLTKQVDDLEDYAAKLLAEIVALESRLLDRSVDRS
jgi:hypothetical protein